MAIDTIQFNNTSALSGGALGASAATPQVGVQGGAVSAGPVRSGADWFDSSGGMTAPDTNLPAFLEEMASPALERAKQQQMWNGFVAAREGQTLQQIDEEQPWYTKIFGPTNYQIGAMTYETQKQVADMENDLLTRMPELRKASPEEFAVELNRMSTAAMTGNFFADSVLQKSFMERAGPITDLYTKERVAWQQAELLRAQVGAASAAGDVYQAAMRANTRLGGAVPNQEQVEATEQLKVSLFDALAPSRYQNDESYKQAIFSVVRSAADAGNFYVTSALADSGIYGALDVEDAQKLERYVQAAHGRAKARWAGTPESVEQAARINALEQAGLVYGSESLALRTAFNERYMAETGSPEPYYDQDALTAGATTAMNAYIRERRAADKEAAQLRIKLGEEEAKAAAEARNMEALTTAWFSGSWKNVKDMKNVAAEDADRAGFSAFQHLQATDPQAAAGTLVNNYGGPGGGINPQIQQYLQHNVAITTDKEQVNNAFMQQYAQWKMIRDSVGYKVEGGVPVKSDVAAGPATATAYYGPVLDAKFRDFDRQLTMQMDPATAYRKTFGEAAQDLGGDIRGFNAEATKANVAALDSAIGDQEGNILSRTFGSSTKLHPSTRALMLQTASYEWALQSPTMSAEDRALYSVAAAKHNGLEIGGAYGWVNGRGQQSIASYLRDNGELSGQIAQQVIDAQLKKAGRQPGQTLMVTRLADDLGEPVLSVVTVDPDDASWDVTVVRGSDLKKAYDARIMRDTAGPIPEGYMMLDSGEVVPKPYTAPRSGGRNTN